ncbi:gypsy type transposase [Tanacetum coccineum]
MLPRSKHTPLCLLNSDKGVLCFSYDDYRLKTMMAVLWNPTVTKSAGIDIPNVLESPHGSTNIGFGFCPNTSDIKLVRINCIDGDDESTVNWEAKVFTLSTRVWKSVSNIPLAFKTYCLTYGHVSIGGFIYRKAYDSVASGCHRMSNLIVSFDSKNDEFGKVCLPDSLVEADNISAFKFKESLGFRKNGEAVMETEIGGCPSVLEVYEPSGPYNGIGISGNAGSLSVESITSLKCVLTQEHLDAVCAKYFVPEEVHPQLPSPDATMHERPTGKVGMYTRFFDYANYRIPFSTFFVSVLTYFRIPFSQLSVFGSAKFVVPADARFSWFLGSNIVKDRAPAPSEYNVEHINTLIAQASPFLRFPEEFLCWVGISRNYFLNKDTYPRFEYEDGEAMDLNAFIRTVDPRKMRIVERPRAENERPIVTVAKHRTVTLLLTSVVRSSRELSASVDREFVGDASVGDGGDHGFDSIAGQDNVEPSVPVTKPIEAEVPKPKRSKKKRVIYDSEGLPVASHPPSIFPQPPLLLSVKPCSKPFPTSFSLRGNTLLVLTPH